MIDNNITEFKKIRTCSFWRFSVFVQNICANYVFIFGLNILRTILEAFPPVTRLAIHWRLQVQCRFGFFLDENVFR